MPEWWEVNLGDPGYQIETIVIVNRATSQERLREFALMLHTEPLSPTYDIALAGTNSSCSCFK